VGNLDLKFSLVPLSSSTVSKLAQVSQTTEVNAREARRGTHLATCPLTKSGFGFPTRPGLDARFEKSQNLVSTKVPEVIESLKASCNGNGIVMVRVATFATGELSDEFK